MPRATDSAFLRSASLLTGPCSLTTPVIVSTRIAVPLTPSVVKSDILVFVVIQESGGGAAEAAVAIATAKPTASSARPAGFIRRCMGYPPFRRPHEAKF